MHIKENKPMTEAEMAQMKEQNKEFMERELPYMRIQAEYEKLIAEIDEARLRSVMAMSRLAQLTPPQEVKELTPNE